MDIDVDWCLTCQKHIEGSHPYCSTDCQIRAAPPAVASPVIHNDTDDDRFHSSDDELILDAPKTALRWLASGDAGIAAWAADIPPNAPPTADDFSPPPEQVRTCRTRTLNRTFRAPPNLLKSSGQVAPPCLSVSTSLQLQPESSHSSPIVAPSRQSSGELPARSSKNASPNKTSSKSPQTESFVATPTSSHRRPSLPIVCPSRGSSILDIRSWVSPAPAVFVPAELPHPQRQPPPVYKLDSSKFFTLTAHPPPPKKFLACENFLVRGRRISQLAFNDEPPSFRARGRTASRAAA